MTEVAPPSAASARAGCCARGSQRRGLLQRFALVLVAFIFASAIAASGRGSARLIAAAFVAPTAAETSPGTGKSDLRLEASATSPAAELKALESDGGDGDDPLPEFEPSTDSALSCAPVLGKPACVLRGALPADTSRFAGSTRLPRGPPISIG